MTPSRIKITRDRVRPTIYLAELSAGELTRNYVIAAETWSDAQMRALEYWAVDEARVREIEGQAE
jgi:hypothetical protein